MSNHEMIRQTENDQIFLCMKINSERSSIKCIFAIKYFLRNQQRNKQTKNIVMIRNEHKSLFFRIFILASQLFVFFFLN